MEVGEEHRSPDGHYRWDGHAWQHVQVAVICQTCGAGLKSDSASTSLRCQECGATAELRRCPACSTTVHIPTALTGLKVTCLGCGASFGWGRWQAGPVTAGEMAAAYGIPQEQLADPSRRIIGGVAVAAAGFPPLTQGVGCKLEFTSDCLLVFAKIATAGFQVTATVTYEEIEFLGVGGAGETTTTSGGGWMGGGFGVVGMAQGLLFATAMNLLTERTHTSVETIVHLRVSGGRELVMEHSVLAPTALQVSLAGVFGRLRTVRPAPPTIAADSDDASAPTPDPVERLERLANLHRSGALSDEEFERAKQATLEAL